MLDATPEQRGSVPLAETSDYANPPPVRRFWGASGLAAVWAEANTREAIYDAFRRRETFATSGPRIRVRFFGAIGAPFATADDMADAYDSGVPMGGVLSPTGSDEAPAFILWASRDPATHPLERLQVIKGWLENGETREMVYDVACGSGASPDNALHRCPPSGAEVDLKDCRVRQGIGAAELKTLWRDPDFDPGQRAFYYLRALEIPSCRWSTWDAIRAGQRPRPDLPATIQERAWSSPIWYTP
jgi:hypothetical protein